MARTPVAHTSLSHDGSPSVGNRRGSGLPSSRTDRAGAGETEHSQPSSRSGFDRSWELAAGPAAEPRGRSADELFQEARDRELVIRSGVQPLVGCQVGGPSSAKRQTSWSAAKRQKLSHRLQTPRTLPKLLPTTPTSLRESRTGGPIPRTMHEPSWCSAGSRLRSPCTVASSFVEFNTPLVFGPFCFVLACRAVPEDESLSHALHVAVPNGLWQQLGRSLEKAVDQSFGGPVVL